jgi:hypothetical protein
VRVDLQREDARLAETLRDLVHRQINPGPNLQVPVVVPIQSVPIPRIGVYEIAVTLDDDEATLYQFEVVKGDELAGRFPRALGSTPSKSGRQYAGKVQWRAHHQSM